MNGRELGLKLAGMLDTYSTYDEDIHAIEQSIGYQKKNMDAIIAKRDAMVEEHHKTELMIAFLPPRERKIIEWRLKNPKAKRSRAARAMQINEDTFNRLWMRAIRMMASYIGLEVNSGGSGDDASDGAADCQSASSDDQDRQNVYAEADADV